MTEVEWTNDQVIRLVDEYKNRPELWNVNHGLYRVQSAKYEAWSDLAKLFECDIADLRKKFNSILASHRREKGKVRSGLRSSWFLYQYMSFLPNHLNNTGGVEVPVTQSRAVAAEKSDSSDDNMEEEEADTIIVKEEPPEPTEIEVQRPVKRFVSSNRNRLTRIVKHKPTKFKDDSAAISDTRNKLLETVKLLRKSDLLKKKDECDSFGEYIAMSLRKHDERTQAMIKQAINNILFEQEMKKYNNVGQYTLLLPTAIDENPLILGDTDCDK